eukprot:361474-Chlamydomonas_euryale.AAC.5
MCSSSSSSSSSFTLSFRRHSCRVHAEKGKVCVPYSARRPLTAAPRQALWRSILTKSGGALPTDLISRIVALMYADDLALLADSPDDLVVLLGMVTCLKDAVALNYGLFINATKTEIMVVGRPLT